MHERAGRGALATEGRRAPASSVSRSGNVHRPRTRERRALPVALMLQQASTQLVSECQTNWGTNGSLLLFMCRRSISYPLVVLSVHR